MRPRSVAILVLLVALGALAWQAGTAFREAQRIETRQDHREAAVDVATEAVTRLVSFRAASAEADMQKLLDSGTEEFREGYGTEIESFRATVARRKVNSEGHAVSAAVTSLEGGRAEVIVAASALVTSSRSSAPKQMYYRFNVSLARSGETWRLDKLEFVA